MNTIDISVIISLILFYALFAGRTILLYKQGVKVWVIGTSAKNLFAILLENLLFLGLIVWSALIVISALHIELPGLLSRYALSTAWTRYAGTALCYTGLAIFLLALISFGKAWRIGIDENNANELITGGIFKYSRNPIFLFMDLYFIGITLIYPNVLFAALTVCTVAGIHFQILREEQFLLGKFGEKYREYQKYTRRYL
jgi:protein-S-isoprenylcysteine O-methyltransferase Ste14